MNKLTFIIVSLLLIGCCGENELPHRGLKGNVKKLTEYKITVKYDSLNKPIRDTLTVARKYYNDKNQIIELNQKFLFADETMDISYEYNRCNRLQKERVKMSFDSTWVNIDYAYRKSLLEKTISKSSRDSIIFNQIGLNQYDDDNKLIESTLSQIFVDLKSGDTIKNSLQIDKYNKSGIITQTEFKFRQDQEKNSRCEYIYNENDLVTIRDFDKNDSLISTIRFEYIKDNLNNWIERKAFNKNKLNAIKYREIIYK